MTEITFVDGKRHGAAKAWNEKGKPEKTIVYKDGEKVE